MNKILEILKKVPWKIWILALVSIIVIWQIVSGGTFSNRVYNTVLDQLREDQSRIIAIKEEQEKWYEEEIAKLNSHISKIQKEKDNLARQRDLFSAEIARLNGRINELQSKIDAIIISDNPDDVIRSLQRRFPSIHKR